MPDRVYILSERDRLELLRFQAKLANIVGAGVVNRPDGVTVGRPAAEAGSPSDAEPATWFWAKITSSAEISAGRWKYAWTEQNRTATGFADMTDGRSGTTSENFAINACEANNDSAGVQGNSIDLDGQVFTDNDGLELQPVRGDPVVRIWVESDADGNPAFTFEYINAIDGECGASE